MLISELGSTGAAARALRPREFADAARSITLTELDRLVGVPALHLGTIAPDTWLVLDAAGALRVIEACYSPNAQTFVASLARAEEALHKSWQELTDGYFAGPDRFAADYGLVRGKAVPGAKGEAWNYLLILGTATQEVGAAARLIAGGGARVCVRTLRAVAQSDPVCFVLDPIGMADSWPPSETMSVSVPTPEGLERPYEPDQMPTAIAEELQPLYREMLLGRPPEQAELADPPAAALPEPVTAEPTSAAAEPISTPATSLPSPASPQTPEPSPAAAAVGLVAPAQPAALGTAQPLPLARLAAAMGGSAPIVWHWRQRGETYTAQLEPDGMIRLPDGSTHTDPVAAAEAASGHLADGWRVWRIGERQRTLADALAEIYRSKK